MRKTGTGRYLHRGYEIEKTSILHGNTGKPLYSIRHINGYDGPAEKPAGKRPFLTSLKDCEEYIHRTLFNRL